MYNVIWHMIWRYIADYVLLQHGYIAFKDTYTISYIARYISIYIVDWYSNIIKDITKQIGYIPWKIPKVNIIHKH